MDEKEDKELQKAMDVVKEMSMSENEWELYESRMRAISDYNTGIEIATQKGIEERRKKGKNKNSKRNAKRKYTIRNDSNVYKINKRRNRKNKLKYYYLTVQVFLKNTCTFLILYI